MNCWHCNTQLIWGGDHDIGEEDEEYSVVTNLSCPNCKSFVEVYLPSYHFEEKKGSTDTTPCSVENDTVCDI